MNDVIKCIFRIVEGCVLTVLSVSIKTWVSNFICCGLFFIQLVDNYGIVSHHGWNVLYINGHTMYLNGKIHCKNVICSYVDILWSKQIKKKNQKQDTKLLEITSLNDYNMQEKVAHMNRVKCNLNWIFWV